MPPLCCFECSGKGRNTIGDIIEGKLHLGVRGVLQPNLKIIVGAKILEDVVAATWRSIYELYPKLDAYGVIISYRNYGALHLNLSGLVPQNHIKRVVETLKES